jgi:hypothetical protein
MSNLENLENLENLDNLENLENLEYDLENDLKKILLNNILEYKKIKENIFLIKKIIAELKESLLNISNEVVFLENIHINYNLVMLKFNNI